nr:hypothetical protein [Bradyrhizobium lablabi]
MVIREHKAVRLFTKSGHDWSKRFPWIVESALRIRQQQFVLDGEAVLLGGDGRSHLSACIPVSMTTKSNSTPSTCWPAPGTIIASCRSRCGSTTWPRCWPAAPTASTWRHTSKARSAWICSAT